MLGNFLKGRFKNPLELQRIGTLIDGSETLTKPDISRVKLNISTAHGNPYGLLCCEQTPCYPDMLKNAKFPAD